jgi:hypothetical protein
MLNSTVAHHDPSGNGYVMTVAQERRGPGRLEIINCIFSNNSGPIFAPVEFELAVRNTIIHAPNNGTYLQWGEFVVAAGEQTLSALEARGGGSGNLTADPLFVAPESGDFRLQDESPGLDRGIQVSPAPSFDIVGNPRTSGTGIDLGPFERL